MGWLGTKHTFLLDLSIIMGSKQVSIQNLLFPGTTYKVVSLLSMKNTSISDFPHEVLISSMKWQSLVNRTRRHYT